MTPGSAAGGACCADALTASGPELEQWIDHHGSELRTHLARMLGTDAEAEDVLQETWLHAHRNPPDTGPGSSVRAWLYRVATNEALDVLARRKRRTSALERHRPKATGEPPSSPDAILDMLPSGARARVREEVSRLPRKQRDAVWLRWLDGEEYPVIARRLECSEESARANVYHGMKRLRERLRDVWNEEGVT